MTGDALDKTAIREQALDRLVYGANDNHSGRGLADMLLRKPPQKRFETPSE